MKACFYDPPCDQPCKHMYASTALTDKRAKIRPSAERQKSAPKASPVPAARIYGAYASVRVELTLRRGADLWYQVTTHEGSFYVIGTGSIHDLVQRTIEGGYPIRPRPEVSRAKRRRRDHGSS